MKKNISKVLAVAASFVLASTCIACGGSGEGNGGSGLVGLKNAPDF